MEDMRAVPMHQNAIGVVLVIGIARNVVAFVYDKNSLSGMGQPLSDHCSSESCADNEDVYAHYAPLRKYTVYLLDICNAAYVCTGTSRLQSIVKNRWISDNMSLAR